MELIAIAGAAVVVLGPWVLAVVALVRAGRAVAEARSARAAAEAAWRVARAPAPAQARAASAEPLPAQAGAAQPLPAPAARATAPEPLPTEVVAPEAVVTGGHSVLSASGEGTSRPPEPPLAPGQPHPAAPSLVVTGGHSVPSASGEGTSGVAAPAGIPAAPASPPVPADGGAGPPAAEPADSRAGPSAADPSGAGRAARIEETIALVWFTRAGAVAVLLGAAYFLKYAIDNAWLGPWGRIALACAAGGGAVALGEALRARTRPAWIHALQGAGLALLFLAAFGSHALYGLVPASAAFAAVAVAALAGGALAVRHRAELLLALALAGGLLAPVLLSTGEDRPLALFGYLLILDALSLAASVALGFRVVPWLALAGTAALGAGWYGRFFETWPPPAVPSPDLPADEQMGRYFPLGRRAVPLAAAAAFSAAWLATWARARASAPRRWAAAWLGAALLFATGAPYAIVLDRPLLAGAALAAAGVVSAAALGAAGRARLLVAAEVVGFALLAAAAAEGRRADSGAWIAAAALVALVHLAAAARVWLREGDPASPAHTAAVVVPGLAFAGFAVALTRADEGVLRAALVGAAGAAELALGAARVSSARARASVLLGASLGLLAGAAALLFSGATVTVVWAAMAAVAAALGARARDRWWLLGAGLLFAAALVRVAVVDVPSVERAARTFLATRGAEGRLVPPFLVNPRAAALAALAAALLLSARAVVRGAPAWRWVAAAFAAVGWAVAVALAVAEARDLVVAVPPPPAAGDAEAFLDYARAVHLAVAMQAGLRSMVASLVLASCAGLLVAGGFAFRDALHRWLGLGLFGVVLAKLLLADVWQLARLQQVAVFTAVGVLLLAAAFLYARYGRRVAALLRDEPPRAGGALLALLAALGALAGPRAAAALDASAHRIARPIEGVAAPGLHAVEADVDLLRGSLAAAGTLADVRIEGPGGAEVPWALRVAEAPRGERAHAGEVVDPVALADGSVRAVVDLGPAPPRHGELRLDLEGDEFLRPVRLEVSSDGRVFGTLAEGERVWAIRDVPDARRTVVRHPPSDARWVRVTLLPGAGDPRRIAGASVAPGEAEELPLRAVALPAPAPRRAPDGRETLLDVDLGAPGIPVEAVELEVLDAAFERRIRVLASADGARWVAAGGGVAWRAPVPAGAFPAAGRAAAPERLRVPASPGGRRHLRLAIADGDSPPLSVTAVRALWRPRELVFRAEAAGPHTLLAGAAVPAPAYDLAALLARTAEAAPLRVHLGRPSPNARFREPAREVPFSERHRGALVAGLAALFAALAAWAVRLLRAPRPGGE